MLKPYYVSLEQFNNWFRSNIVTQQQQNFASFFFFCFVGENKRQHNITVIYSTNGKKKIATHCYFEYSCSPFTRATLDFNTNIPIIILSMRHDFYHTVFKEYIYKILCFFFRTLTVALQCVATTKVSFYRVFHWNILTKIYRKLILAIA